MNKRLISRLMRQRVSGLQNSGAYFFSDNFDYVLRGIALEYVPRGLYIWNFRFPLFDFFGPNLSYSDRLHDGAFIGKGEMSEEAIVDRIMDSPEAQNALAIGTLMSVSEFIQYLTGLRNSYAQLIHAAALVLVDQESLAAEILDEVPSRLHPNDVLSWNRLRASLQEGPKVARALLDQVRQENLKLFDLA